MLPAVPELSATGLKNLSDATDAASILAALSQICESLGMSRFLALRTQGIHLTRVTQVLHNVPEREAAPLEAGTFWTNCTELHGLLRAQPPFTYSVGEPGAPFIPAPGFTHGVASCSVGSRDACVLVLGSHRALDPSQRATLRAYSLLAATYAAGPMSRLPSAACPLTERELECLRLAVGGMSSKEAAPLLGISWRTVDVFLARARTRLGVDSTFAAGMAALDYGWITLEETKRHSTG